MACTDVIHLRQCLDVVVGESIDAGYLCHRQLCHLQCYGSTAMRYDVRGRESDSITAAPILDIR